VHVVFRPEEIHLRSSLSGSSAAGEREVGMPNNSGRKGREHLPIPYFNSNALIAVKAWTINAHRFARK
jgi:hypothetical protein